MKLQEFEKAAHTIWAEIPEEYKQGIDGLVIEEAANTHQQHDEFFTLGECVTEAYPSEFGGPDTIRSAVVLYYGSFAAVAEEDEAFAWAQEIEETLLHELQHHLEHLAEDDALVDLDYAVEENFKRVDGQPFDPLFFQAGDPMGEGIFRVDRDVFITVETKSVSAMKFDFQWADRPYSVAIPESAADMLFVVIEQEMPGISGELCVVRLRRKSVIGTLRATLSGRGFSVEEVVVKATPA